MAVHTIADKINVDVKDIYSLQLLSVALFIFTLQIWQLLGFGMISMLTFTLGVGISLLCGIGCLVVHHIGRPLLRNIIYGLVLEVFALCILLGTFIREKSELESFSFQQRIFLIVICVSLVVLIVFQIFQLCYVEYSFRIKKVNGFNFLFSLLVICFFIGIGFWILNSWPRWDSFNYYFSLEQDISIKNIFGIDGSRLTVCGHPCGAFVLLELFLQSILRLSLLNTVYISNIFLLFVDFIIAYYILKSVIGNKYTYLCLIAAFAFTCSPYILGSVFSINAEHLALTGMLLFLLGAMRSDYYLCIIACYIVCNTRESCVPVVALLILVQFVYDAYYSYNKTKHLYSVEWMYYASVFMAGITWLSNFQAKNWGDGMKAEGHYFYSDGRAAFTYGFDGVYIINQLKGVFLTNFSWICLFVIILSLLLFIVKKKKHFLSIMIKNKFCMMMLCSIFMSLAVVCVFLTHHNYRYYTIVVCMLYMLALYCVIYTVSELNVKACIKSIPIIAIEIIMLAQCYVTIDPVMLAVFPSINTGRGQIAYMPWNMNNLSGPEFLDNANYNFQVLTFDKIMNKVYANIKLENSRVLIYDGYQWGTLGNTLNSIWGHGYEYRTPPSWGVWNEEGQYRELSYNPAPGSIINPIPVSDFQSVDENLGIYDTLYYLEIPWGDTFVDKLKQHYPKMEIYKTIEYQTWSLNIYLIQ